MKLAIRPKKIPIGATQAIMSRIKNVRTPFFFEKKKVPNINPINSP